MSWSKMKDAPAWGGQFEILNLIKSAQRNYASGGMKEYSAGSLGCIGLFCVMCAVALGPIAGPLWVVAAIGLGGGGFAYFGINKWQKQSPWQGDFWTLVISDGRAEYRQAPAAIPPVTARPSWIVPVDAIARVETSPTSDYLGGRDYGGKGRDEDFRAVPKGEWHVFLFLNNGTRRPIHYANANRDDCAELAASIRAHLESTRPSSAAPAKDAPRPSGFDL